MRCRRSYAGIAGSSRHSKSIGVNIAGPRSPGAREGRTGPEGSRQTFRCPRRRRWSSHAVDPSPISSPTCDTSATWPIPPGRPPEERGAPSRCINVRVAAVSSTRRRLHVCAECDSRAPRARPSPSFAPSAGRTCLPRPKCALCAGWNTAPAAPEMIMCMRAPDAAPTSNPMRSAVPAGCDSRIESAEISGLRTGGQLPYRPSSSFHIVDGPTPVERNPNPR